jgi:glycosyltransferase involved in cell wall biosynthesis
VEERDGDLHNWLTNAAILFTDSESTKRDAVKLFPRLEAKIKVVPWAADIPAGLKPRDIGSSECAFYYPAAHCAYQKNHLALFEAAVRLAEKGLKFKIIISGIGTEELAGEKPLKDARVEPTRLFYQQHKNKLSGHVKMMGDCTPEQIEELYGSASCVVLPSTYEGFGLPLSEALARGIPVICSDLGVFQEQISLYNCAERVRLFPAGNTDVLTKYMEEFIRHPKSRVPLEIAREKLSHWTWRAVAKAYVESMEHGRS